MTKKEKIAWMLFAASGACAVAFGWLEYGLSGAMGVAAAALMLAAFVSVAP